MKISEEIAKFFSGAECPILFAGAGVSAKAGLPVWSEYIKGLTEMIRSEDPLTSQQMREHCAANDYVHAAEYFRMSKKILEGDKRKFLKRPLESYQHTNLLALAALPFKACITTNFDRSVFDAIAKVRGITPIDYRYGDASFKQSLWETGLYVARIHGAVEMPESMVLASSQFESIVLDDVYMNLLRTCFTQKNFIFLGFSFYDPAIQHVLNVIDKNIGPASHGRHVAVIPESANSDFLNKANRLNIKVVRYNAENGHAQLWDAIERFSESVAMSKPTESAHGKGYSLGLTKQYLAGCYARAKSKGGHAALREAIVEGIVSAVLQESSPAAIGYSDLLDKIRLTIGVKGRSLQELLERALESLESSRLCMIHKDGKGGRKIAWKSSKNDAETLDHSIRKLVSSLSNRALLQEGWQVAENVERASESFFKDLIRRRGWDLGVAFASGKTPEPVAIDSLFIDCTRGMPAYDQERLRMILDSMLKNPSVEEAEILGELGKVSFALELAFQAPGSVFLHNEVLPRNIYFDANVLLPALVEGHPYSPVYAQAIRKLQEAATKAAFALELKVSSVYLNEVISHKRNAEEYAAQSGNDFWQLATMDALYHGSTNVNVFVSGFANWAQNNDEAKFLDYLKEFAPYSTESELADWLKGLGFSVVWGKKEGRYADFNLLLEKAYSGAISYGKRPILIEHDAIQLALLDKEAMSGAKTIFVTADRQLQQIVFDSKFHSISELMVSHVGLIQLIEMLLGGLDDNVALMDLMWSSRISEKGQAIRSYFISRGLEQYDEGMAMTMPDIVDTYVRLASQDLDAANLELDSDDPAQRVRALRRLGVIERKYIDGMSEAVRKLRDNY